MSSPNPHRRDIEPWVAGSLSWMIPGAGHLYVRSWRRALLILALAVVLNLVWLVFLTSPALSPLWLPSLIVCSVLLVPGLAVFTAYRDAVRSNSQSREQERGLAKDPWLAVFLSLVFPGAGHAYLRKGWLALIAATAFWALYFLARIHRAMLAPELIVYVSICVHAYAACQVHRRTHHGVMIMLVLMIVLVSLFTDVALPQVYDRFVFTLSPVWGVSMNPALTADDEIVVNRYAYRIGSPRVGDVVGFTVDRSISEDSSHLMKRIVATGGETVQIRDGRILIDGKERDLGIPRNPDMRYPDEIAVENFGTDGNEFLAFGVDEPFRVPEDHYFVLGDNLAYSADSRCFGPVPRKSIEGKAVKILWPPRRIGNVR